MWNFDNTCWNHTHTFIKPIVSPNISIYIPSIGDFDISEDGNKVAMFGYTYDNDDPKFLNQKVYIYKLNSTTNQYEYETDFYGSNNYTDSYTENITSVALNNDGTQVFFGISRTQSDETHRPNTNTLSGGTSRGIYHYTFDESNSTWNENELIFPFNKNRWSENQFGRVISIDGTGNILTVGDYLEDSYFENAGAVYYYFK